MSLAASAEMNTLENTDLESAMTDFDDIKIKVNRKKPKTSASTRETKKLKVEEAEECCVCSQTITKFKRKAISCPYCDNNKVCTECVQRYLLSKSDAHCMGCRKVWTKEFLKQHFTKVFVKERLSKHQTEVLAELEKSLFPATMEEIEATKQECVLDDHREEAQIQAENIERVRHMMAEMVDCSGSDQRYKRFGRSQSFKDKRVGNQEDLEFEQRIIEHSHPLTSRLKDIKTELQLLTDDTIENTRSSRYRYEWLRNHWFMFRNLDCPLTALSLTSEYLQILETKLDLKLEYISKLQLMSKKITAVRCSSEKCPGFLSPIKTVMVKITLDNGTTVEQPKASIGNCLICQTINCYECKETLKQDQVDAHICDADLLKTIKLVTKNSKPCPSCKVPIEKINGCDQMFCTNCKTAFDWKTNQIVLGKIHNPHYFDYLKNIEKQGAVPNQDQPPATTTICQHETLFTQVMYQKIFRDFRFLNYYSGKFSALSSLWQVVVHLLETNIRADNIDMDPTRRYRSHRVSFLKGLITEDIWKDRLHLSRKSIENRLEIRQRWEAFIHVANNLFENFWHEISQFDQNSENDKEALIQIINKTYNQACQLVHYVNEHQKTYAIEQDKKTYSKIFIPNPYMVDQSIKKPVHPHPNLNRPESAHEPYNYKCRFSLSEAQIAENELDYIVDKHFLLSSAIESAVDNSLESENHNEKEEELEIEHKNDEVKTPSQELQMVQDPSMALNLTEVEQGLRDVVKRIVEVCHYFEDKYTMQDMLYKREFIEQTIAKFMSFLQDEELNQLLQNYNATFERERKAKRRTNVMIDLMGKLKASITDICYSFFNILHSYVQHQYWAIHKKQIICNINERYHNKLAKRSHSSFYKILPNHRQFNLVVEALNKQIYRDLDIDKPLPFVPHNWREYLSKTVPLKTLLAQDLEDQQKTLEVSAYRYKMFDLPVDLTPNHPAVQFTTIKLNVKWIADKESTEEVTKEVRLLEVGPIPPPSQPNVVPQQFKSCPWDKERIHDDDKLSRDKFLVPFWYPKIQAIYYCDQSSLDFVLDPALGFHQTRKVQGFNVTLPMWAMSILDETPSFLYQSQKLKGLYNSSLRDKDVLSTRVLCMPFFTAYIDNEMVHPFDVMLLPLLVKPQLSMEDWECFFNKVWLVICNVHVFYANEGFCMRKSPQGPGKFVDFQSDWRLRNSKLAAMFKKHIFEGESLGYLNLLKSLPLPANLVATELELVIERKDDSKPHARQITEVYKHIQKFLVWNLDTDFSRKELIRRYH